MGEGREGARYIFTRSWFQSVGAIAKEALLLMEGFLASFRVATQRSIAWEDLGDLGEDVLTGNRVPNHKELYK